MTNKPMLIERDKFEAFWRKEMNVEVMDLHRCEFPMTAYNDQPYACHETERGRLTWMARAAHDNPSSQHQGEPVAWRGLNAGGEVVTEWIDGQPPERMTDLCGNAASFDKIEHAYAEHPAPVAVVLPGRKVDPHRHQRLITPGCGVEKGTAEGWNACLAEVAKLNGLKPSQDKEGN